MMTGQTISHYDILEKLGEGGMGVVYKALDTKLNRAVALKFLPPGLLQREEEKKRIIREAQAAASLNHPNIATVHEMNEIEDQSFIVMEYIEGRSLAEMIRPSIPSLLNKEEGLSEDDSAHRDPTPLPMNQVLDIVIQIAEGLHAAHENKIVHRDIKPGNVMVTESGRVKLMDFGLVKMRDVSLLTKEGTTLGTVPYMSPEQAQGDEVDRRTDIWSLGVLMYELFTGKRPFRSDYEQALIYLIINEDPEPLRKQIPDISPDVEGIVNRMLKKKRDDRYSSAAELLGDLNKYQESLRQEEPGIFNLRTVFRQLRRPQVVIPTAVVIFVTILVAGWFFDRQARIRWALEEALPDIKLLMDMENFDAAFRLAHRAGIYIPDDRELLDLQRRHTNTVSINSTPPGADVYVKGYLNVDADWLHVGQTPMEDVLLPAGYLRWKLTKEGFTPLEQARYSIPPVQQFTLHSMQEAPAGMAPVAGGPYRYRWLPPVNLKDYWLDKYEVTNEQFQEFVDQGGYQKREFWKHPFVMDDKVYSWEEAMIWFRDATGRPGPSTWQLGRYDEGRGQLPVNGVSWFEAAAYAEFAGKSLPTVYHWMRAHATPQASEILKLSNFSGEGPAQVGSHLGLSPYGHYDMAGNVREWCWNEIRHEQGGWRSILGASWNEAPYRFGGLSGASPWDRSEINGFRCAKYDTLPANALTAEIEHEVPDFTAVKPVSDELFEVYRNFYSYERTPLEPEVENVDDSALHWRQEKITFNAAYGDERVIAYLFLPRNAEPPYQTIVYFASGVARQSRSPDQMNSELRFVDFLPRIGRAVLFLVYKGTYERHMDHPVTAQYWTRDLIISWSRDFSRAIDYLETRSDIDKQNIGYFSFSNPIMPVLSALDGRIKAGAHIGSGLGHPSWPPEYNAVHFAPRAKEPTLLIGGHFDFLAPVESSQIPLLNLLGAPEEDKKLALFDTGHVVYPGPEMIKEVLDWFDRYLGPVK